MILLVNGPNLNLLGEREPEIYGSETLADVERMVTEACAGYGLAVVAMQSNHEGAIIDFIQQHRHEAKGLVINPGGLTHTSVALHDCLKAVHFPVVEVHISNIHAREEWRQKDLVARATRGQVVGLGTAGYYYAALWLCTHPPAAPMGEYDEDAGHEQFVDEEMPVDDRPPVVGGDYEG